MQLYQLHWKKTITVKATYFLLGHARSSLICLLKKVQISIYTVISDQVVFSVVESLMIFFSFFINEVLHLGLIYLLIYLYKSRSLYVCITQIFNFSPICTRLIIFKFQNLETVAVNFKKSSDFYLPDFSITIDTLTL